MSTKTQRNKEYRKYNRLYYHSHYGMGERRLDMARKDLKALPVRGAYLDAGCGRGEMLEYAKSLGFSPVIGTEVLNSLIDDENVFFGEPVALPFEDKSFDVVCLFDVLEHLIPEDEEVVCHELKRVARKHVLLTANNKPSYLSDFIETKTDAPLHINIKSFDEWHRILKEAFAPGKVMRLKPTTNNLARWRIDFNIEVGLYQ